MRGALFADGAGSRREKGTMKFSETPPPTSQHLQTGSWLHIFGDLIHDTLSTSRQTAPVTPVQQPASQHKGGNPFGGNPNGGMPMGGMPGMGSPV